MNETNDKQCYQSLRQMAASFSGPGRLVPVQTDKGIRINYYPFEKNQGHPALLLALFFLGAGFFFFVLAFTEISTTGIEVAPIFISTISAYGGITLLRRARRYYRGKLSCECQGKYLVFHDGTCCKGCHHRVNMEELTGFDYEERHSLPGSPTRHEHVFITRTREGEQHCTVNTISREQALAFAEAMAPMLNCHCKASLPNNEQSGIQTTNLKMEPS